MTNYALGRKYKEIEATVVEELTEIINLIGEGRAEEVSPHLIKYLAKKLDKVAKSERIVRHEVDQTLKPLILWAAQPAAGNMTESRSGYEAARIQVREMMCCDPVLTKLIKEQQK